MLESPTLAENPGAVFVVCPGATSRVTRLGLDAHPQHFLFFLPAHFFRQLVAQVLLFRPRCCLVFFSLLIFGPKGGIGQGVALIKELTGS